MEHKFTIVHQFYETITVIAPTRNDAIYKILANKQAYEHEGAMEDFMNIKYVRFRTLG